MEKTFIYIYQYIKKRQQLTLMAKPLDETPKHYVASRTMFPLGRKRIAKDEIGKVNGLSDKWVAFLKPDEEKAKELLLYDYEAQKMRLNLQIREIDEDIENIRNNRAAII